MSTVADRRHPARILIAFAAAAMLLAALLVPAAGATTPTWIVPSGSILPAGARIVGEIPVAGAFLVSSPIAPTGGVRSDTPLSWKSDGFDTDNAATSVGAPDVWQRGDAEQLGANAVVALIDTGVAPIPGLTESIAGEINFSGRGRGGDDYGHGTFLASLISSDDEQVPGVAPAAGILSLKVADRNGDTDVLKVLSALQWLHGPGRDAGVRIATLALGVDHETEAAEILDEAVATLAGAGTLVLTAAGKEDGKLTSPATAPGAFAVGAFDSHGAVPAWSGTGTDRNSVDAKPDVSALGVSVVGLMPRSSVIGRAHSDAYLPGTDYMPGSGTSMSTAIAAGVAALASSERPDLDGPALAGALRAGGPILDASEVFAALEGTDVGDPSAPAVPAGQRPGRANPVHPRDGGQVLPESVSWRSVSWRSVSWRSVSWRSVSWRGNGWGDADWDYGRYGGVRWTGGGWHGDDFSSVSWRSVSWRSVSWRSVSWRSVSWRSVSWRSVDWGLRADRGI
jgi:serine protease AprX